MSASSNGFSSKIEQMPFVVSKKVISRRNQDGTIVLMKLDETSLFYKIEGLAVHVWTEFQSPKTLKGLLGHLQGLSSEHATQLAGDLRAFVETLVEGKLLVESAADVAVDLAFAPVQVAPNGSYRFGGIKEFNLEQIETEVLNESIYLDVFAGSDLRLKRDVAPIEGALAKVIRLDGIVYRWDPERVPAKHVGSGAKQAGLVAQQVAEQMPELVRKDEGSDLLAVNYAKLNAYLVEAIKEMNQKILAQEDRIARLEAERSR